ncbi:hypothetical protein [Hymenobacter cellulosilyticus]|uniref:hypothetical protein n=1 Tax=Hymenobacter cellulosilyticus TaxID=2932248 RepID=UPI0035C9D3D4
MLIHSRVYWSFLILLSSVTACRKSEQPSPGVEVSTLAGSGIQGKENGPGAIAKFTGPEGVAVDTQGNVYVADGYGNKIRKITPTTRRAVSPGSTSRGGSGDWFQDQAT